MFTNRNGEPRVGLIVTVFLAVIILVPLAVWGFRVATSDIKGQGDAVIQKNDATNRINKQEMFEQMYANVKASDDKIQIASDAVKTDPSYTNKTNLTGATSFCVQAVQDYNAEARKYSAADFRSTDLPAQIDEFDPQTDCKPDNK